jgi:hypothetical protein
MEDWAMSEGMRNVVLMANPDLGGQDRDARVMIIRIHGWQHIQGYSELRFTHFPILREDIPNLW